MSGRPWKLKLHDFSGRPPRTQSFTTREAREVALASAYAKTRGGYRRAELRGPTIIHLPAPRAVSDTSEEGK